ncbi:patatin-like phospholipase family protein [Pseudonocardia abyssalis]|uniref:Patatin-like phospholipase family protein n=1 Tax=Pseudonocardia abyssalis TaxID=2792008 RepID=A0ABS6UV92_9PSEU|nr:patatin-like phospholipase family protein [Pseudonocardia abyssalis]MBW0117890.1 patatin-like phospholipase family protein [Pseudonocardia abyssalis]MBW0136177.1 patatin-like phospholipase family protein [Pseudonocardia abyssalis]
MTGPFLRGDLDVLRVLLDRRGTRPGARTDPHRVALVVGGGGMRGAYVAGMLHALDRAGLREAFDEVYGASSGAVSAASFLTGRADAGAAAFPEDLASSAFIDLRRLATGRPAVSIDHLIDTVLGGTKPLPWEVLRDGPVPLHVVATDAADLQPHVLTGLRTVEDWQRALRATAAIPLLAGPPVEHGGRRWVDGSVGEPLATARALRGGATHVLVLVCRPESEIHAVSDLSLWARTLDVLVPGLGTLAQGIRRYDLRLVTDAAHPDRGPGHLLALGPSRAAGIAALSTDPSRVAEAVEVGDASAQAAVASLA